MFVFFSPHECLRHGHQLSTISNITTFKTSIGCTWFRLGSVRRGHITISVSRDQPRGISTREPPGAGLRRARSARRFRVVVEPRGRTGGVAPGKTRPRQMPPRRSRPGEVRESSIRWSLANVPGEVRGDSRLTGPSSALSRVLKRVPTYNSLLPFLNLWV